MRRGLLVLVGSALAVLVVGSVGVPGAAADFGFKDLDVVFTHEDDSTASQAGSHPFAMTTSFSVNTEVDGESREVPQGETKDLILRQVEGLAGNPNATPQCATADFIVRIEGASQCPNATAVGVAGVRAAFFPPPVGSGTAGFLHVPVFNLVPPPGVAAKLGFVVLNVPVTIEVKVSEKAPHNIVAHIENIPQILLFYASKVTLWGNPADDANDPYRGSCVGSGQSYTAAPLSSGTCSVNIPEKPFLTLPRACQGPLETTLEATSWQSPTGPSVNDSSFTNDGLQPPSPQGMSGCGNLKFSPEIAAKGSSFRADAPTGLGFSIDVKDEGLTSATGFAHSDIRRIVATLPVGMTANPSAAEGLGACTVAEYESAGVSSGGCPESSKIGTIDVRTPILENRTLHGAVYLAQPDDKGTTEPGSENPFDSLLALYMVIRDPQLGIAVTQAARIDADPISGRLVTTVQDIPQFPLSDIDLHLRGGSRAPLVTPPSCGAHQIEATFTPWAGGNDRKVAADIEVTAGPTGGPCPSAGTPPFQAGFEAGALNNNAGSFSPFYMRLTRRDGDQDLTRFSAQLPPGVLARLAGTGICPDAGIATARSRSGPGAGVDELAAPSCPSDAEIGRVTAGAGVGDALTYVPGKVYLAGSYRGAPLSVVAIVPAVAGPFDLGVVTTRLALRINPRTAEVTVDGSASDPIPHILAGIPLRVRDIRAYVDRPDFTLNSTSCDPSAVTGTLWGGGSDQLSTADDMPFSVSSRFQIAGCAALGFRPTLSLRLTGGTRRAAYPALRGEYRPRPGDANLEELTLRLPASAFLEQAHIRTICTRPQFAANACPKSAVYGYARAWTPLLDAPLEGPVYLRANGGERLLPDVVADLRGLIEVEAVAYVTSRKGRIQVTFAEVPDAPLSKVVVSMQGGKKGLIVNSVNLCVAKRRANAAFTAHNKSRVKGRPLVKAAKCGKRVKRRR